jgi:hypothetical protein
VSSTSLRSTLNIGRPLFRCRELAHRVARDLVEWSSASNVSTIGAASEANGSSAAPVDRLERSPHEPYGRLTVSDFVSARRAADEASVVLGQWRSAA